MVVVLGYPVSACHLQGNVTVLVKIISISILPPFLLSEWSSVVSMPLLLSHFQCLAPHFTARMIRARHLESQIRRHRRK